MLTVYTDWLHTQVREFIKNEKGASAVEYGLIVGLIAVAIIAVLTAIGGNDGLKGLFIKVSSALLSAQTP